MGADVTFGSTLGGSLRQAAIAAAGSSSPSRKKEHSAERPAQRARVQRLARAPADRGFGVVAMAASAGGLRVLGALPSDFRVPTVVVQHLDPHHRSLMAEILGRRTPLHVKQPADREGLPPATVYIAPPDQHLLVNPDHSVSLAHSDLVRFLRPSADPLFESVAVSFGDRAIAVVLSGTGADAAAGARAIKGNGGTVIAQEPLTSEFPGMPAAAIETGCVDSVLPLEEIGAALVELVMEDGAA